MRRINLWLVLALMTILVSYSLFVEPQWISISQYSINRNKDSSSFKIALLSDLHLKKIGSTEKKTLHALEEIRPEVIVLAGDLVDGSKSLAVLERYLESLPPALIVATVGNWEHWSGIDLDYLRQVFNKHSAHLLINECLPPSDSKLTINIIGLDDFSAGSPNIDKAIKSCDSKFPVIIVEHSPQYFDHKTAAIKKYNIELNLAAHTHGGQIALFGHPLITPPGSGRFVKGWYQTNFGKLYVTTGIGTSILPFRFGVRPSITTFEIYEPRSAVLETRKILHNTPLQL